MNEQIINGIKRESWVATYQRVMRFAIPGSMFDYCTVLQPVDINIWREPQFSASGINSDNVERIRLHAEALRQAAEVMEHWSGDVGKEVDG